MLNYTQRNLVILVVYGVLTLLSNFQFNHDFEKKLPLKQIEFDTIHQGVVNLYDQQFQKPD